MNLAQWRHPRHFATWCISCDRHRKVDLLRTIVVRFVLCRRPCQARVRVIRQPMHKRPEYCSSETPTYSDLTDTLFSRIMTHQRHVLQPLLHDRHSKPYSLRQRTHDKTLLNKSTQLNHDDLNAIHRLVLVTRTNPLATFYFFAFYIVFCLSCVWRLLNKRIYDDDDDEDDDNDIRRKRVHAQASRPIVSVYVTLLTSVNEPTHVHYQQHW